MNENENMEIFANYDLGECHGCGKRGKGFILIGLRHLCQHYVSLCPKCLDKLRQLTKKKLKEKP